MHTPFKHIKIAFMHMNVNIIKLKDSSAQNYDMKFRDINIPGAISRFHGGEYEDNCLLKCCTV
jgi:hypothetical protein